MFQLSPHKSFSFSTRSVIQVRSHAQKYFIKLQKMGHANEIPQPRPKRTSGTTPRRTPRQADSDPESEADVSHIKRQRLVQPEPEEEPMQVRPRRARAAINYAEVLSGAPGEELDAAYDDEGDEEGGSRRRRGAKRSMSPINRAQLASMMASGDLNQASLAPPFPLNMMMPGLAPPGSMPLESSLPIPPNMHLPMANVPSYPVIRSQNGMNSVNPMHSTTPLPTPPLIPMPPGTGNGTVPQSLPLSASLPPLNPGFPGAQLPLMMPLPISSLPSNLNISNLPPMTLPVIQPHHQPTTSPGLSSMPAPTGTPPLVQE